MQTAICPGSFDPVTNGHQDIIERAAKIFSKVVVAVLENPSKTPLFSVDERSQMLYTVLRHLPNIQVKHFSGLLVNFAAQNNARIIIKGLRAISDFEIEFQMAMINKYMFPELETMFMMTKNEYSYLSSSLVKELASFGANIKGLVDPHVEERLREKIAKLKAASEASGNIR
ncbi:MAG: pantetheine-phosphate adenylyltransferase [Bacillota bacterium]